MNDCRPKQIRLKIGELVSTILPIIEELEGFQWIEECDATFRDLKSYLANPPVLSRREPEKDLFLYLVVSNHAVSSILIRYHEGIQRPIYYLSKTLVDAETRYMLLEKMVLALVHATRKLPYYFQVYIV